MSIYMHIGLQLCSCEYTSLYCIRGRQISLNSIGNITLGTELVIKAAVSLPSDTISQRDQLVWEHRDKKGNLGTDNLFFPDIFEIECTLTWRYIETFLIKMLLGSVLDDTYPRAVCPHIPPWQAQQNGWEYCVWSSAKPLINVLYNIFVDKIMKIEWDKSKIG